MLTGQYQRSLDSKSRVTLPVIMRKQFGETVMLVPWKDALHGFTPEAFETWENNLGLNPRNREDNDALLYLNSMTTTVGGSFRKNLSIFAVVVPTRPRPTTASPTWMA